MTVTATESDQTATENTTSDGPPYKAAIDIGTNSIHLVVARVGDHGGFEIVTTEKEMVRLGEGTGPSGDLSEKAIARGIDSLSRLSQVASSFGDVELVVVATSAVREAPNQQVFIDRAREEVGLSVEVISGFEEARLIHLGVLQALPVFDQRRLLVDIGGGSTELLVGESDRPVEARSMKLGAIRLTRQFFPEIGDLSGDELASAVESCRDFVRAALAPVAHELGGHQPEVVIGSSGTATTLASIAAAARGEDMRQMNGTSFTADELATALERITTSTTAERRKIQGLEEKRVDIIVGGAILLSEIFRAFDVEAMTISDFALREGVLFDRFGLAAGVELEDLRRANLLRLARSLDPDPAHAEHTAELATQLFDRTKALHGLGNDERELLEAAAIVHNVGLFISHAAHHKHSYYVIRNSEKLTGFTEQEIETIALVARYHRRAMPAEKHAEFTGLSNERKAIVRKLAGLLRLAIGLDRSHTGAVTAVRVFVDVEAKTLGIEPVSRGDVDLSLEIYAAAQRSPLLADALDVDIEVRPRTVFESDHASS